MMTENLKEALQYVVGLSENQKVIHHENDKTWVDYSKGNLVELEPIKYAESLSVNTLTGLVEYLQSKFANEFDNKQELIIHISDADYVRVETRLNADRKRESLIVALPSMEQYPYGKFLSQEAFIIKLKSLFLRELDAEAVVKCASSIRIEGGADLKDDGFTQMVTVKQGAALENAEVPSPAELTPYRTFLEIEQPTSQFVFRINDHAQCALFEADGGMWKYEAKENIKKYLEEHLKDELEAGFLTIIG